ncbi:hypothetical protein [Luteolibacter marinus]|uniref:hypothetical protein n=1 Tax=Luteolibacter marinus TaxID=2776705 RepID=UPI001867BEAA|nr:hypothetical protein [Luteolibacter marinus]
MFEMRLGFGDPLPSRSFPSPDFGNVMKYLLPKFPCGDLRNSQFSADLPEGQTLQPQASNRLSPQQSHKTLSGPTPAKWLGTSVNLPIGTSIAPGNCRDRTHRDETIVPADLVHQNLIDLRLNASHGMVRFHRVARLRSLSSLIMREDGE